MITEERAYKNLATAVIQSAVNDQKEVIRKNKREIGENGTTARERGKADLLRFEEKKLTTFFRGYWFETLCEFLELNPESIRDGIARLG